MKKVISVLLLLVIIFNITTISNATSLGDMISGAEGFIGKATEEKISEANLQSLSNTLFNVLLVVAFIASLIVGALIGIKFITEGAEAKANMKQALVPYIIGNVVVFGAFGIWKLVVGILNTIA